MSSRSSSALIAAAASVLALAPLLALVHGTIEPLSWLRVLLVGLCAWGAARSAGWARWGGAALALWLLREVWIAWRLSPALRALVPQYRIWAFGNAAAALLLIVAVVLRTGPRPESGGAA